MKVVVDRLSKIQSRAISNPSGGEMLWPQLSNLESSLSCPAFFAGSTSSTTTRRHNIVRPAAILPKVICSISSKQSKEQKWLKKSYFSKLKVNNSWFHKVTFSKITFHQIGTNLRIKTIVLYFLLSISFTFTFLISSSGRHATNWMKCQCGKVVAVSRVALCMYLIYLPFQKRRRREDFFSTKRRRKSLDGLRPRV